METDLHDSGSLLKVNSTIAEITGAPGSGKTTFLKSNFANARVFRAFPEPAGLIQKSLYSIFLFLWVVIARSISLSQLWWLLRKAFQIDENIILKLNAFRNSVLKFSYQYYQADDEFIVIDEGISHIPFILELQNSTEVNEFIELFRDYLVQVTILFIDAPSDETIMLERLRRRGHSRIKTEKKLVKFVQKNRRVAELYKESLQHAKIEVTLIG